MLSEASELEHMLMLEYLFAAFSLKTGADEGLTEEQLGAVRRWERIISEVAAQEMLHLASASNLLTAIGSAPHFSRPNFPQPAKYYPPGIQLALTPFSEQALGNFVLAHVPVETIVEQGEGARAYRQDAHFGKFLRVLEEYLEFKRRDPDFEPARRVTAAWVRPPADAKLPNPTLITDPTTAGVADLFNATYEVMVQMLVRFFAHTEETEEELQTLSRTAVEAMSH